MRVLLIADLRSPIAQSWVEVISAAHDVHVISSHALAADLLPDVDKSSVALAFGSKGAPMRGQTASPARSWLVGAALSRRRGMVAATYARDLLAPLEVRRHAAALRERIDAFVPDIVHALRVPYEGMAAVHALADGPGPPLAVSIWGNDLTLHARKNALIAGATRRTLRASVGLHADCRRDLDLARHWGWDGRRPTLLVPGSGGLDLEQFRPGQSQSLHRAGVPEGAPVVLNPRGLREYVRTDIYAQALARVLDACPDVHFVSTGVPDSFRSKLTSSVARRMVLPGKLLPHEMADVYRGSTISVSPSLHDGTPNTLLEAMATGCLPVVHPVESVMEWIQDGVNGVVVDANDANSVADGMIRALLDDELRASAEVINRGLVVDRADRLSCASLINDFYERVVHG